MGKYFIVEIFWGE